MTTIKIKQTAFDDLIAFISFSSPVSAFLRFCLSILLLPFLAHAQDLPDKIRGYKVYDAIIVVGTANEEFDRKLKSEAQVKIGEPELTEVSFTGVTFELSAEIFGLQQSGTIDFLTFRDFRVNDLAVEIEDYTHSFELKKNQIVKLPKPARISLGATQALRGALRESRESKAEWQVTGRVFVFGKFKKFGFSFKRVVPVEVNIKIKNPLKQMQSSIQIDL
ncbi:MAG TPA: hypothetical protein VF692_08660 [Pyrinomonadaceae bacterium]|jgi:hypothetical protein